MHELKFEILVSGKPTWMGRGPVIPAVGHAVSVEGKQYRVLHVEHVYDFTVARAQNLPVVGPGSIRVYVEPETR